MALEGQETAKFYVTRVFAANCDRTARSMADNDRSCGPLGPGREMEDHGEIR